MKGESIILSHIRSISSSSSSSSSVASAGNKGSAVPYHSLLLQSSNGVEIRSIHHHLIVHSLDQDVFLSNHLIQIYGKHGFLDESFSVFYRLERRNVFSWTTMIIACVLFYSHEVAAFQILENMFSEGMLPIHHTFSAIVGSCICKERGKRLHVYILNAGLETNAYVGSSLIDMYGKCGCLKSSQKAFDLIHIKDSVSWTAMITIYASNESRKAIDLYFRMERDGMRPNEVTFSSILVACVNLSDLVTGRMIHAKVYQNGFCSVLLVANALLNMYGKCGHLEEAKWTFNDQNKRDTVSWNSIILAHTLHEKHEEAIKLFTQMGEEGIEPNDVTFVNVLSACAELIVPIQGKVVHSWIVCLGFDLFPVVSTALVSMYGKCGCINDADNVFYNTCIHDVVSWTSLIEAYASHGYAKIVVELLLKMQCEGVKPDAITYISVLSSCSHAGWVDEACQQFKSMNEDYSVSCTIEHYGCLIDLYGRVGKLEEAEMLMFEMPFLPNDVVWEIFLSACQAHHDLERGRSVAEQMIWAIPECSIPYVLASNIYTL